MASSLPCAGGTPDQLLQPLPDARIEIRKQARTLKLFSGEELVREFRIGLGFNPVARKTNEGDGATPEGDYRVCVKNPESRFLLSLGLSYPNVTDADRSVDSGLISRAQHEMIVAAHEKGGRPPWDTPLGGEIYIHGNGSDSDWTLGCIALDDSDMQELYPAVRVGTEVHIRP